jgi:hypothetical protein
VWNTVSDVVGVAAVVLTVAAIATCWVPGLDVVTAGLAVAAQVADYAMGAVSLVNAGVDYANGNIAGGTVQLGVAALSIVGAGALGKTSAAAEDLSAQEIIQSTARAQAARGVDALKGALSPGKRAAMEDDPGLTSRMLGQAVHRLTAGALDEAYPGRFLYRTRSFDFVDTETGEGLELTTPGQVGPHLARPGYDGVTMCTYTLPAC